MTSIFKALTVSILLAACGQMTDNSGCDLTKVMVQVTSSPNDQTRTKAEDFLKRAREARDKKDFAACEANKKQAEQLLKL